MTKKHFKAIAATIRNTGIHAECKAAIAHNLAFELAMINPKFDRAKFVTACMESTY